MYQYQNDISLQNQELGQNINSFQYNNSSQNIDQKMINQSDIDNGNNIEDVKSDLRQKLLQDQIQKQSMSIEMQNIQPKKQSIITSRFEQIVQKNYTLPKQMQDQLKKLADKARKKIATLAKKKTEKKDKKKKSKKSKKKGSKNSKNNNQTSDQQDPTAATNNSKPVKFNAYEQYKALRNQFRKKKLEMSNYEGKQNQPKSQGSFISNLLKDNLFIRKSFRISLLVLFTILILCFILIFYYSVGFVRGSLILESCSLMIYDYNLRNKQTLDVNFLSGTLSVPSDLGSDQNIYLQYIYPKSPFSGRQSSFSEVFNYLSMKGSIEIPYFVFQTANVNTREGDISIQTMSDVELTYTQKDPYNCISSKQITDISNNNLNLQQYQASIQFQPDNTLCQAVYPWGLPSDQQKADRVIEYRCYSNKVILKNQGTSTSKLTTSNSYGNINVNVISAQGQFVQAASSNYQVLFNKVSKTENQDNNKNIDYINLSNLARINLLNQTKAASNPKIYDPIFVFDIGTKFTRSATFQQVQFSYNPAYTFMKPYWLGELTLTLMTTQKYTGQYTLSPGFCPYVPALNLEKIYNTQYLITNFMEANFAPQYALATNAWQPHIEYPPQKFQQNNVFNGFRDLNLDRNLDEQWIGVDADESKNYSVTNYDVTYDSSLCAAIVVSCILSGILGIVLLVILMFVINQNYIWVLNHIQSIRKYAQLEKGGSGEIDESTLDTQKRRLYFEYREQQQLIEDQNKKALQEAGENPDNKDQGAVPKYTITSIFSQFYQLIYLSPPLSALIDYIVLLLQKAKQNSIREFYKLLFKSKKLNQLKENDDEEIHSLDKDQILGNEMKQLYEKFCFLNQYLERKFDDEENLKYLTDMGFKIAARLDAQTQFFTYIKYNGTIPTMSEQPNKSSLDLFISSCCNLTNFETDRIESSELDNYYQEFCTLNHMQKEQLNEGSLKRDYGIQTIYLPQQWVERDEKYDIQKLKRKYFIDKKRVENNFNILLAKDSFLFSILYDSEDFQQAQKDIKVPTGWQFFDLITVVAHVLVMTLIGCPLLILTIFIRAQQSTYSLISPMRLIYFETIVYYPSSIPAKLMGDNWIVQAISIIALIFWILSFFDLIYYYASMDFPQEKYFNKYKQGRSKIRNIFSSVMWIIVLMSFYTFAVYFSLVAIWLMLSAIINPNAFLPYATSAATFVTLVAKKYKDFEEISQNGFKFISDYLQELAQGQFQELLKKMDIQDKIASVVPVDTIKDITAEASKLGLIDPSMSENIQNNLEIMIRDPSVVSQLGQELIKISQDPQAFAQQMTQKLEEKAKALIQQQVSTLDKELSDELVNLIWCLLKNQKSELKNSISSFVNALINGFQKNKGQQSLKSIGFINLKGPVFDFIWEFAFPVENFKGNYQEHLINIFCITLANVISVWNKDLKQLVLKKQNDNNEKGNKKNNKDCSEQQKTNEQLMKEKLLKDIENAEAVIQADDRQEEEQEIELTSEEAITYAYKNIIFSVIQICRSIQSSNSEVIFNQILNLVQNGSKIPGFDGLSQLKQYQDIFKIGFAIFKNDGEVDFEDVNNAFKGFLKNTGLEDKVKDITGVGILDVLKIVEVIIQSFKGQSKLSQNNSVKKVIQNLIGSIEFSSNQIRIRQQEFKEADEIHSLEECDKLKNDVNICLNETKIAVNELEQQRLKIKQNEQYYEDKLQDSLYYLRIYLQEVQQKINQEMSSDDILNANGDKIVSYLQNAIRQYKNNYENVKTQLKLQKEELIKSFPQLKKKKDEQYQKIEKIYEQIDLLKAKIKNNLEDSLEERKEKIRNIKEQNIKLQANLQTKKLKKIEALRSIEDLKKKIVKKVSQISKQQDEDEEEELILSEGNIQVFNISKVKNKDNEQLLNNYEIEDENQDKQIKQFEIRIKTIDNEIEQTKKIISKNEEEIQQIEQKIEEIQESIYQIDEASMDMRYEINFDDQESINAKKNEQNELDELYSQYYNQQEAYDSIVNEISENMMKQEQIVEKISEIEENAKYIISDSQAYIDEFKISQKTLNKVQQEKIDLHQKIDDLQEKQSKYEEYIEALDQQCQNLSEEQNERNQINDENNSIDKDNKGNDNSQKKDDHGNYLSSGLTVMLNLFSGQIANLQTDLIKELGSFFDIVSTSKYIQSEEVQEMFIFLKDQIISEQQGGAQGKQNSKSKEKINNFQSILHLIDIFLNDSIVATRKIIKNGKENLLESEVAKSLQVVFVSRFDGFIKQKALDKYLIGSDLLELISKVMKMKEDVILGFMELLLGYKNTKEIHTFVSFAASLNKIKENKVNAFMHLFNLYSSKSPSELYDALVFFQVIKNPPKEYESVTIKDLVLVLLFMREQLDFIYVKSIFEDKLEILPKEQQPISKKQQEMKDIIKANADLPNHFKKLFEIEIKGYLQQNTIQADFKQINKNLEVLLEQSDFNFFKKFLSIRSIPKIEDPTQNTLVKSCITDISDMLNIEYQSIELFINLLTSSKSNKLKQALDTLQILKINPKCDQGDINSFVEFSASTLEKIELKNQNISNISKSIFQDSLPLCLLRKILYHEGVALAYSDYLLLFNIYTNNQIPTSMMNLIDFRYGMTGNRKRDIYKFLHPLSKNIEQDYQKFKKSKQEQGLIKAVQILSINDQSSRIQTFLQYLIKTKQEALLMASCLLVYFSGRSNNIILYIEEGNDKKQKKVNVEQLLCILLQVKQEFFEAVHTYFSEDTNYCTQTMIKFYRQLDYLQQQAGGDYDTILENNITISDKTVEQYVRLVNHIQFNTSFISKDTKISIEAVELVSNLMYIKNSKNEQERNLVFEQMRNNSYISKLFSQLGVNHQEFVTLVKIMYQDYEPTNIKWVSKSLKLPPQFKIDGLQQLIMLDQILPVFGESSQNKKFLINLIKTNKFVKIFKVNQTWAEVAYILCKGDFCLLSKYQDKLIPLKYPTSLRFEDALSKDYLKQGTTLTKAVNAKDIKYMSLIQGLAGLLSCRQSTFQTTEFLYQLYTIICQKYVKDEQLIIEDGLKKGNTLQYAIYKFTKSTQINPVWTLLMMGDFNAWEFIAQSYYLVNNGKNPYINPILALVYVLNFRSNPLIVKQLLIDLEYAQRSYKIYIAKLKKDCSRRVELKQRKQQNENQDDENSDDEIEEHLLNDIKKKNKKQEEKSGQPIKLTEEENENLQELENKIKGLKSKINNLLTMCLEKDGENLTRIVEDFNFPQKIVNMLLVYDHDYGEKKKMQGYKQYMDYEEDDESDSEIVLTSNLISDAFQALQSHIEINDSENKLGEFKELDILNLVFEKIGTYLYTDPRKERMDFSQEEKKFTSSYCLNQHSSSPLMQMMLLSTIAQLKLSYYDFYGFDGRDEEHKKQVAFAVDLILSTLEKYYFFDDMMDFFPRHRLIPLIGLSVGFIIDSDDILYSNTCQSVFDQRYYQGVIIKLCEKVYDRQKQEEERNLNGEDQKLDKKQFQKYIELKKFDLKYKYFAERIVDSDIQYQIEQNDQNYGMDGVFKGIDQYEVFQLLEDQNTERLIDNYEDITWFCYYTEDQVNHMTDPNNFYTDFRRAYYVNRDTYNENDQYSGEKKKKLFEYLDNYKDVAESENFQYLIDVFKENYKSLNNNDYFAANYSQDSNMYFGTLILNGIIYQQIKEVKMEDFQNHVTSASLFMTSNKKALAEILSLLIPSIKSSFSSLNEILNDQEESISSFINLTMGKSINQSRDLEILLSKSSLTDLNRGALKDCVWAYQGEMREYLKLIYHSPLFQQSPQAVTLFTEFLWSFEKSSMHKNTNNPYEINYFDFCNLSPNRDKALEKAQQYLWNISQNLCYQKKLQDDKMNDPDMIEYTIDSYLLNNIYRQNSKIQDKDMSQLLQKILYNDWNFLITNDKYKLQDSFNVIFDIKEAGCLDKLQILALIKPQKSGLKIQSENLDELISYTKINNMINAGGELFSKSQNQQDNQIQNNISLGAYQLFSKQNVNEIQNNENFYSKSVLSNFVEAKYLHLLLSLSNNSIVHILNCLNTTEEEWSLELQKELNEEKLVIQVEKFIKENNLDPKSKEQQIQFDIFNKYNTLKKESINQIKVNIPVDTTRVSQKNKQISYILQSLFLWKNISNIKWDPVLKNIDTFVEKPYQFKELKNQIEFLFSYVDYLQILPAVILDKFDRAQANKSPSKKKDKKQTIIINQEDINLTDIKIEECYNLQKVFEKIKLRSLDTEIFTRYMAYERNSIYMIYQSYENLVSSLGNKASILQDINQEELEEEISIANLTDFREKIKGSPNSREIYYLFNFLNGSFLKEIEKVHPLIEYISNLYFKGLQAIHTQNAEPITQYLQNCINDENSYINLILKDNSKYAKIFNKVLNIIFTISFCTINSSKITMQQKQKILNQVDDLLVTVAKDLLSVDDNIVNLVYAIFYLITNQETESMKNNPKLKDKQNCLIILLKIAFENPDLSEFFFGSHKTGESLEQVDKMINTITSILQSILDRPSQSINDSDLVKEVLKLIKYASKGNIDVTIIEDIIAILTGDHQRVFNILKKFEIVDENKIALIQRAYNQVVDMPIFNQKDSAIVGGGQQGPPDKIKEIVKKLQDGKVTIRDVFVAVDAEGDNNGKISIEEFQSFVRRLGMELSKHRVNEIFASIKNKKQKIGNVEQTDELTLNIEEFEKAFKYVNDKKTSMSLEKLGISPALLALALGTLVVILILLFAFIFLGIKAFAVGGTFGSIINSIIPMAAAGGAAGSQENKKDKLNNEEISDAVAETQSIVHSENI